jgi:hypothetical protein
MQWSVKEILASIPVPAKMVRHFAVVTLVITACIALFADGERREAIGAEIRADQQRQQMRALDAERTGPRKIGAEKDVNRGSGFGEETSGSGGDTSVNPDSGGDGAMGPKQYRPQGQDTSMMPPGYFNPSAGLPKSAQIAPPRPKPLKRVTPADMERLRQMGEERAGPATQPGT